MVLIEALTRHAQAYWLKVVKAKGDFWRGKVSDELFSWAIDNFFVKSHTNNHIEGIT